MSIHSVNLVPYKPEQGFLLCEEMRKISKNSTKKVMNSHIIGGKLENEETPLQCGCREFCEELPFVYNVIEFEKQILDSRYIHIDIVVSKEKNLINRFYIF